MDEGRPTRGGAVTKVARERRAGPALGCARASRQHGVVSIRQLEAAARLSQRRCHGLVDAGRLHRIYLGCTRSGTPIFRFVGNAWRQCSPSGPGAVLSYYSAGWLWGLWSGSPAPFEVTAFVPRHHQPPKGVRRHRARNLDKEDRAMVDGIPVTSVARTLLDLAWKLRSDQLRRVLARAEDLGLLDLEAIHAVIERNRATTARSGFGSPRDLRAADLDALGVRAALRRASRRPGLPRPATGWNEVGHVSTSTGPSSASGSNSTPG